MPGHLLGGPVPLSPAAGVEPPVIVKKLLTTNSTLVFLIMSVMVSIRRKFLVLRLSWFAARSSSINSSVERNDDVAAMSINEELHHLHLFRNKRFHLEDDII
ncbi:hypothetical protein AAZX31_08G125200 [Glycine max]